MSLNGVAIGDLHLDKLANLFGEEQAIDLQIVEIKKPLDWAIEKGLTYAFFLGDICEKEVMSIYAHMAFVNLLAEYDDKLISHIILGNHDFAETGENSLRLLQLLVKLKFLKNVFIWDKPTAVKLGGVTVNFLPHPFKRVPKKLKTSKPSLNIAHIEPAGAIRDNGMRIREGVVFKDQTDVWLIGHLHTFQEPNKRVHLPGTLYQTNFGESMPKGWMEFSYHIKNGVLVDNTKFIKNTSAFRLINLEIKSVADFKKIKSNPLWLYKLFVKDDVPIPPNLMVDHPNIAKPPVGYANQKELDVLKYEEIVINQEDVSDLETLSIDYGLVSFLKNIGATKKQVGKAKSFLTKIGIGQSGQLNP